MGIMFNLDAFIGECQQAGTELEQRMRGRDLVRVVAPTRR